MTPEIFQILVLITIGGGGWFMKTQYSRVTTLERDLVTHKVEAAKSYVTKPDIVRLEGKIDGLRGAFDASIGRVMDRLDGKADRP
jgi:hypothetical protein